MTLVENTTPSAIVSRFDYQYNAANQRTRRTEADGAYWSYSYDKLGQVTNGVKKLADGTTLAGQDYGYWFDDIGNRRQTTQGTNAFSRYYANQLNQYTSRTVPGVVDISGTAAEEAVVTVNNQATTRQREYFHKALNVPNETGTTTTPIHVVAVLPNAGPDGTDIVAEEHGEKTIPGTPQEFTYDLDGNMTSDGEWNYVWNGENRLIQVSNDQFQVSFAYDHQGRRVSKIVDDGFTVTTNTFFYDGWNMIQESTVCGLQSAVSSYTWGLDLSGTLASLPRLGVGAGGIGGLLAVSQSGAGVPPAVFSPAFDGNGNVTEYVDTNGTIVAHREYSPFGQTIVSTGTKKDDFNFWFSSKYEDTETELYYYGYRYYDPELGRWLNRDKIGEKGGVNVYSFSRNNGILYVDVLGLRTWFKASSDSTLDDFAHLMCEKASDKTASSPGGDREYCGLICKCNSTGIYLANDPHAGNPLPTTDGAMSCRPDRPYGQIISFDCPNGFDHVASFHSHPSNSDFSQADKDYSVDNDVPLYLGRPDDTVWRWDPDNDDSDEAVEVEIPAVP